MGGWTGIVLLLFGSIFIVPSEGVTECYQCAELYNSTLDTIWKEVGGTSCFHMPFVTCTIGLLEQTKEFARLAGIQGARIPTSYRLGNGSKGEGRQGGGSQEDAYGACMSLHIPVVGGKTQMFYGCLAGPTAMPCGRYECQSRSSPYEDFRPSDKDVNVISCGCTINACDPELLYKVKEDRMYCGVGGLRGPLKIIFLGLLLVKLLSF